MNMPAATLFGAQSSAPDAPPAASRLWAALGFWMTRLAEQFPAPAALLAHGLAAPRLRDLRRVLFGVEHLVRFLVAEAAMRLAPTLTLLPLRPTRAANLGNAASPVAPPDLTRPETWRVAFSWVAPPHRAPRRRTCPKARAPRVFLLEEFVARQAVVLAGRTQFPQASTICFPPGPHARFRIPGGDPSAPPFPRLDQGRAVPGLSDLARILAGRLEVLRRIADNSDRAIRALAMRLARVAATKANAARARLVPAAAPPQRPAYEFTPNHDAREAWSMLVASFIALRDRPQCALNSS